MHKLMETELSHETALRNPVPCLKMCTDVVFTTEEFFELAIEGWPECLVGFKPTTTEFDSDAPADCALRP